MSDQNDTLGFYKASFFRLHISTKSSFNDIRNWGDLDYSIFLHEYIHFIQDISTYYGLSRTNAIVEYLRFANNHIIKDSKTKFAVPIAPESDNQDNVLLNREIARLTFGDSKTIDLKKIKSYKIINHKIDISNSQIDEIGLVEVHCEDMSGNERLFTFGAACIMESMAFLLEQLTCEEYHPSPNIPYHSAELIAKFIHPKFAEDKLNITALCDISLGVSNPGAYFISILNSWKLRDDVPSKPETLYQDHKKQRLAINKIESNEDHFKIMSSQIKMQLKAYFNDPYFDNLKTWIDHLLDTAAKFRNDFPTFIIDIARSPIKSNPTFELLFNLVGTPMLSNDNKEYMFYDSTTIGQPIPIAYFWAINQILNIFRGNLPKCEMIEFCKQPGSNTTVNLRCLDPWMRSNESPLCPFGLMWKHWGLKDYSPLYLGL